MSIFRHCEERLVRRSSTSEGGSDEAIHPFFVPRDGLLRSARNDGEGITPPRAAVGLRRGCRERVSSLRCLLVIARSSCDEAIHTFFVAAWIASRSLSSGAHSRDPLARKDVDGAHQPTRYSVIARSSCDEAIHSFFVRRHGLLRCARNDGDGVWSASCQRVVEVLPRHCEERLVRRSSTSEGGSDGAVLELVGIEGGVVSGVINLESSGVEASDWRPRHDEQYHEA